LILASHLNTRHAHLARDLATEFATAFKLNHTPDVAARLVTEELFEVIEAYQDWISTEDREQEVLHLADLIKEICDLHYVLGGYQNAVQASLAPFRYLVIEDLLGQWLRKIKTLSFITSDDLCEALSLVHSSNMSKLGSDGLPIYNFDGKVMKGVKYEPPSLLPIARRIMSQD
jgi:hypothetical protein